MNLLTQTGMHDDITVIDVVDSTMTIGRDMLKQGVSRPFGIVSNQSALVMVKRDAFSFHREAQAFIKLMFLILRANLTLVS